MTIYMYRATVEWDAYPFAESQRFGAVHADLAHAGSSSSDCMGDKDDAAVVTSPL